MALTAAKAESVGDILKATASAKALDDEYLMVRNREPAKLEKMGGPRAVSQRYIAVMEVLADNIRSEFHNTHLCSVSITRTQRAGFCVQITT